MESDSSNEPPILTPPAEAFTARLRPFEDDEVASAARKRRRTSASGSPAARTSSPQPTCVLAVIPDLDKTAEQPAQSKGQHHGQSTADSDAATARLQSQIIGATISSSERDDSEYYAPKSPEPAAENDRIDEVWESVEAVAATDTNLNKAEARLPEHSADTTERKGDTPGVNYDPAIGIPYAKSGEEPGEPLYRILTYLSNEEVIEADVLDNLRFWMKKCVDFLKAATYEEISQSYRQNLILWRLLPEISVSVADRLYSFDASESITSAARQLCLVYCDLTATVLLNEGPRIQAITYHDDKVLGSLLSPKYLAALHTICIADMDGRTQKSILSTFTHKNNEARRMYLSRFTVAIGDAWEAVTRAIVALAETAVRVPKAIGILNTYCNILANVVENFDGIASKTPSDVLGLTREHMGHVFKTVKLCLENALDKGISFVACEDIQLQLPALSYLLFHGMADLSTTDEAMDGKTSFAEINSSNANIFSAWKWKLDFMCRLIKCSQMQLRIAAMELLSNDLMEAWMASGDAVENVDILVNNLGKLVVESGLIDYFLDSGCPPEIIAESGNVVAFLMTAGHFNTRYVDSIWQSITMGGNPRKSDAVVAMFTSKLHLLDYDKLIFIISKIADVPLEQLTEPVTRCWDAATNAILRQVQMNNVELKLQPLQLYYRMLHKCSRVSDGCNLAYSHIQGVARLKLKELLDCDSSMELRRALLQESIESMKLDFKANIASLWCIYVLLRPRIAHEIQSLGGILQLMEMIVNEAEDIYVSEAPSNTLAGEANVARRDVIFNLVLHAADELGHELGLRLWNILVGLTCSSQKDRDVGWSILVNAFAQSEGNNIFIRKCFSNYLRTLHSTSLCLGALEFVQRTIAKATEDDPSFDETENALLRTGIEHLWRMVLSARDEGVALQATHSLILQVYLHPGVLRSLSSSKRREVHSTLIKQCLGRIQSVVRSREDKLEEQGQAGAELKFIRSLRFLTLFICQHRKQSELAVPDLRPFIPSTPKSVDGESARLHYQSFDGSATTTVKPLNLGSQNTAGCLLASLQNETGFENYELYYRGKQCAFAEDDICKSLEDLQVQAGLILVKRDRSDIPVAACTRPGSTYLEIEILSHFAELWSCWQLSEVACEEVLHLLMALPAEGYTVNFINEARQKEREAINPTSPLKSIYISYAIGEYALQHRTPVSNDMAPFHRDQPASLFAWSAKLIQEAIVVFSLDADRAGKWGVPLLSSILGAWLKILHRVRLSGDQGITLENPSPARLFDFFETFLASEHEGAADLLSKILSIIALTSVLDGAFWSSVAGDERFDASVIQILNNKSRPILRSNISETLSSICISEGKTISDPSTTIGPPTFTANLHRILTDSLCNLVQQSSCSREAICLLQDTTALLLDNAPSLLSLGAFIPKILSSLRLHKPAAVGWQQSVPDTVLAGLVAILWHCISTDPEAVNEIPSVYVKETLWNLLFPRSTSSTEDQAPAQTIFCTPTRAELYDVVKRCALANPETGTLFIEILRSISDSTSSDSATRSWIGGSAVSQSAILKDKCGYVGLFNFSNTCYLNSLLAQLFMNVEFRQFILSVQQVPEQDTGLLGHSKDLFFYLQNTVAKFIKPLEFVKAIKTFDNEPIDETAQMDVDEFYNLLFDRWENELHDNADKKTLRSFYGGVLVQQVKSLDCEHISETLELFSAIQCEIKGKSTLAQSLQAYIDGEILDGENKYKCSTCDTHVTAVKRACLTNLPDHLIFHLKRFEFNLRTLHRSKINDYFSFPEIIDMNPFTVEHLKENREEPDKFVLVGVLVHSGTAESGHYYSFVRESRTDGDYSRWIQFNDELVSEWHPSNMADATFGGLLQSEEVTGTQGIPKDKMHSAYMLFYQRESVLLKRNQNLVGTSDSTSQIPIHNHLRRQISEQNTNLLHRFFALDECHLQAVFVCLELGHQGHGGTDPSNERRGTYLSGISTAIEYLCKVAARDKRPKGAATLLEKVEALCSDCFLCALAAFNHFHSHPASLRGLLQNHPAMSIRILTGRTLSKVLRTLTSIDLSGYNSTADGHAVNLDQDQLRFCPKQIMFLFNDLWENMKNITGSNDCFIELLTEFAKLGRAQGLELLNANYFVRAVDRICRTGGLQMDWKTERRNCSLRASLSALIRFIDSLLSYLQPKLNQDTIVDEVDDRVPDSEGSFPWTSAEISVTHNDPTGDDKSLFVERLLSLALSEEATTNILSKLIGTGPHMDLFIRNTLLAEIKGDATGMLDSFIRGAACYIKSSESKEDVIRVMRRVCTESPNFHGDEGTAFMELLSSSSYPLALTSPHDRQDWASFSLDMVLLWGPHMLSYPDARIRDEALAIIERDVIESSVPRGTNGAANHRDSSVFHGKDGYLLKFCTACLEFLARRHVSSIPVQQDAAECLIMVIERCSLQIVDAEKMPSSEWDEYSEFCTRVIETTRALAAVQSDESLSDGEASMSSTDPMVMTGSTAKDASGPNA